MEYLNIKIGYKIDGTLNSPIEDIFLDKIFQRIGSVILSESVDGTEDYAILLENVEVVQQNIQEDEGDDWNNFFDFG